MDSGYGYLGIEIKIRMLKPTLQNVKDLFEKARKAYPGVKRGLDTEFAYFCKVHKDWKQIIPLLKPAILEYINRHETDKIANRFVPPWKNFKTWLYNRCWEETVGVIETTEEKAQRAQQEKEKVEEEKQRIREAYQGYLESKTTAALGDIKKDKPGRFMYLCSWLIDEIIAKRKG